MLKEVLLSLVYVHFGFIVIWCAMFGIGLYRYLHHSEVEWIRWGANGFMFLWLVLYIAIEVVRFQLYYGGENITCN